MIYAIFALPSYLQRHREILNQFMEKHGISEDDLKNLPSDDILQGDMAKLGSEGNTSAPEAMAAAAGPGEKKDN